MSYRKSYLVTGGGGFVGKALCKALLQQGAEVRAVARSRYPELEQLGVICFQGDISDPKVPWNEILKDVTGVFHTAAKVEMWGKREDFLRVNVEGTKNLLLAAREAGVKSFVFTSSPSVIADGLDLNGINESYPYPKKYKAQYPETKAEAERYVLNQNGLGGLHTLALRPHLIFGPGDTNLIPAILERASQGKLLRIGSGKNMIDLTHIDDCVQAHIKAMEKLETQPESVAGKAYFISQGQPVNMWEWIDSVLIKKGLPRVRRSLPTGLAMAIATVCEAGAKALELVGIHKEPLLTRFLVSEMATNHYFDISAARNNLGYEPSKDRFLDF